MARAGACIDCGATTYGGKTAAIPARCSECNHIERTRQAREAAARKRPVPDTAGICVDCGASYYRAPRATRRVRCDHCRAMYSKQARNDYSRANPPAMQAARRRWYERNAQRVKAYKHAARVRVGAAQVAYVRTEIFKRDDWTCYLCGGDVDPALKFPDKGSASLDHVLTLSRGGDNSPENVRLAHMGCNWAKGAA